MNTQSVTVKAVVQRINHKLEPQNLTLKCTRGIAQQQDLGEYYLLNFNRNFVIEKDVNPETLARHLRVLSEYERCV